MGLFQFFSLIISSISKKTPASGVLSVSTITVTHKMIGMSVMGQYYLQKITLSSWVLLETEFNRTTGET